MLNLLYGAIGTLGVLVLFAGGIFTGWRLHGAFIAHNHKVIREEMTEEQKQRFAADQAAWEAMMNYSTEAAYGLTTDPLEELTRKRSDGP